MTSGQGEFDYKDIDFELDDYLVQIKSQREIEKVGILFLPDQDWQGTGEDIFKPETFNFIKWAKQQTQTPINIVSLAETKVLELRSNDFWLPLVYLFNDASLQIYLNLAASYLYDKMKGVLKNDNSIIDLEVILEDKKRKVTKRFKYHGNYEGLAKIVKKVDINDITRE